MVEKTKNNIKKETEVFIDKITFNWPKWFKISCGLLFVAITWFIPIMNFVMIYKYSNSDTKEIAEAVKKEIVEGDTIKKNTSGNKLTENVCNFKDLNNWIGIENFEIEQGNIFKPVLSEKFPEGREMFCNQKMGMDFSLPIKFTPLNENKINISINYGYLWRIIMGNNDYKQIQIQLNDKYLSEDKEKAEWKDVKGGRFWINRPRGLMSLKQVKATIVSKLSDIKNKKVNVSVYISGVSAYDETDYELTPPFSVDLSLPKDKKDFSEKIGIGILDTKKEGVKIQLEEFKLQELNSLD